MFDDADTPHPTTAHPTHDRPGAGAPGAPLAPSPDPAALGTLSNEALQDELCTHAAHLSVAECQMVLLVGELDRRGIWADEGLRSCAHWLNWRCGVSLGAAREQVRVGRALADLPLVRAAFGTGEISYSKVRAITRIANRRLEEGLVAMAREATASQLERVVREYRRADPDEGPQHLARHDRRYVRSFTDDEGMVVLRARFSPEEGAVVLAAIEAARQAMAGDRVGDEDVPAETRPAADDGSAGAPADHDGQGATGAGRATGTKDVPAGTPAGEGTPPTWAYGPDPANPATTTLDAGEQMAAERADALVAVCEAALAGGLRPPDDAGPAVSVVVHVDEAVLVDPTAEGCAYVEEVGAISSHTVQRLCCGAATSTLGFRPDGSVVPEGRTRRVPGSLRRAVRARDGGCRWPGCTQRRYVDVHHVTFVSAGGRTALSNLTTLCKAHHRLVHEGGFSLTMVPSGQVTVRTPDGAVVPRVGRPPVPAGPDLYARHEQAGLTLGPSTLTYGGEPFDLGLTIDALWCQSGKFPTQQFAPGRAPALT